jgi:hypothetical protein
MYFSTEIRRPHSCQRIHLQHFTSPRYRHYKVWGYLAGFGSILVTVPRAELKDTLHTNNQSLQFFPHILRHLSPQILKEEMHTAILWEKEGVKTHTLALIKGS